MSETQFPGKFFLLSSASPRDSLLQGLQVNELQTGCTEPMKEEEEEEPAVSQVE